MVERSMVDSLQEAGDVGADLLSVDWSATPVGEPDTWPLSLKNAVRILLSSKFSMWMAWGEELTFFCNDAYRRDTLGTKYPWALGRPAAEVWSEIWPDIGPRIARVMSTGEATWDEGLLLFLERYGYVEETYHTFSYSPLADDDGTVAGMLCVVTEDTEQVVGTARMATLRDLGVRVGAAPDEREAVRTACERIALDPRSLPFAAVYLFDGDATSAGLAGAAGFAGEHPVAPARVPLDGATAPWPVDRVWAGESVLVELSAYDGLPRGAWPEPPTHAYLAPLPQPSLAHPSGFLLAGLNRYRPFDDAYCDFVELVAGHLAATVSDARAIETEKQRAETLARLDQAKTDFFANVSHELRTPLTLMLGPAEDALADREQPLPDVHRTRVGTVLRNGRRMLGLVNTLLDFSRLEGGRARSEFRRTDVGQLTAELVAMFGTAADRAGLRLDVDAGPGEVEAWIDRDHWTKIVLNLVSNALKFTMEGEIAVRVAVDGDAVVLTVRDTGSGIPESEVPHLFERFHRVAGARSRSHEGSGIGLALVAELVALHGGTVGVASRLGEGSTFTVSVPLGRDHLEAAQVVDGADEPGPRSVSDGPTRNLVAQALSWLEGEDAAPAVEEEREQREERPRVLVVDDNADMRSYVADLLRPDHEVTVAGDGLEALSRMADQRPHLVLTDVMMPRLDGFGLLQRMRADPALSVIPVIMLSARAGEEGTLEGLHAGAVDYLVKPFSSRELLARVRVNLELDREQQVRHALERSEALLDQAQRLARIGSWEIDLDTDTIVASHTFHELMEMDRATMDRLGTTAVIESLVHPDDLAMVREQLARAMTGEVIEYETRIVLPSGERLFHARGEVVPRDGARLLRGSFQDVTDQRATQQRLTAAEAEREAAVRERRIAEQLQASLLPESDFEIDSLEVATFYRAGVEGTYVGGDWYDVIDLGAGRTAFVIGDVMGRGVPAAAVMGQLRAAVRAFATLDLGPVEVLEHLDNLVQDLAPDQIVTCVYAVHDSAEQTLTYANAGHLPPLLARHDLVDTMARIDATGPPLGAGYFGMTAQVYDVRADDLVVLYTDGLVERRGEDILAGISQLAELVRAHGDHPLPGLPDLLVRHLAGDEVDDDVALVLIKVAEPPEAVFTARLAEAGTAPSEARRAVARELRRWGVAEEPVDDIVLIASELVTNALVHARPPIDLRLRRIGPHVILEIRDRAGLRPRRRRPDDSDEHGRGLNIVEVLSESWGTRTSESGKTVWCTVRVEA
jgi:signal transduction histidine kinase/serine phosphatase RsbU (regulator of sigma subunit)/DNA-binding response OmpR family regulator